jgi:hypothetical protein
VEIVTEYNSYFISGNNNPDYTYEITAPIVRAAIFKYTGLAAGTYTVRVNSGRGSAIDNTVVVAPATPLTIALLFCYTTSTTTTSVMR